MVNICMGENRNKNANFLITLLMAEGVCQAEIYLHIAGKLVQPLKHFPSPYTWPVNLG